VGQRYLIDSNAASDFLDGLLPPKGRNLLNKAEPFISIITQIEVFSYKELSVDNKRKLTVFVENATVFEVDELVALKTINLRLNYKIKLADAIIAATALHYHLTLITHNTSDFKKIKGLKLIDPYNI